MYKQPPCALCRDYNVWTPKRIKEVEEASASATEKWRKKYRVKRYRARLSGFGFSFLVRVQGSTLAPCSFRSLCMDVWTYTSTLPCLGFRITCLGFRSKPCLLRV